jgi:hypothetical protein
MDVQEALVSVWRQSLLEGRQEVTLGSRSFPVRLTPRKNLRQVDFSFDGEALRGLEQNPHTASRCAQLARTGHKVMQFLSHGRYNANVVVGKITLYNRGRGRD